MKKKRSGATGKNIPQKRVVLFKIIGILFPFVLLALLEGLLRIVGYGENYNLFVDHPDDAYDEYLITNPIVGKKYFRRFDYTSAPNDIFLKKKPDDVFRIFVMGSSTVVGFPYDYNLMFSRLLHQRLEQAYPKRKIEVVNTAITAINSFTLRDYMRDIRKHEPDAIVFYAGHNEFYGAFGIGSNEAMGSNRNLTFLHMRLMDLRLYQWLSNMIQQVRARFASQESGTGTKGTLMKRIVKKKEIVYKSDAYHTAMDNFRKNLSDILAMADKQDIPVLMSNVVSNVRDLPPFASAETPGYDPADVVFDNAKKLERVNKYAEAKEAYEEARDLDVVRFRASGDINGIIEDLADQFDVRLVDMLGTFEENSQHHLVGDNLLTEHVHPNIAGQFLMADAFYKTFLRLEWLGEKPVMESDRTVPSHTLTYFKSNWGYTALDSLVAHHRITNLKYHWPFRDESEGYVDYRTIYEPVSTIDSIAFNIMRDPDFALIDGHDKLAKQHEQNGDYYRAFREYNAMVKINPYWAPHYRDAATCLIQIADLPMALDYLNKSLQYEPSFYAYYRAGEIYMIKNKMEEAVRYFEHAYNLAPSDKKINALQKLFTAYAYAGMNDKANEMLRAIKKHNPGFDPNLGPYRYTYMNYVPMQVKPYISEARSLLSEGKRQAALDTLMHSLQIKDTHIANRMIGEIYLGNKNYEDARYFLEKDDDEFNTDPRFLHGLFVAYMNTGAGEKARSCVRQIRDVAPGYGPLKGLEEAVKKKS